MSRIAQQLLAGISALILANAGPLSTASAASEDPMAWIVSGTAIAEIDEETIRRLTGRPPESESTSVTKNISIIWSDALLESDGRSAIPIQIKLDLTVGLTMPVGKHTPYPGLITKVDSAKGEIVNLRTQRRLTVKLSERGSWIAKLIHSDSHGPDHLALELPFSLVDGSSGVTIAENNMVAVFDIVSATPTVNWARLSPTPYGDLRLGSTDVGRAIQSDRFEPVYSNPRPIEAYNAEVSVSRVSAIVDQSQRADLFGGESLSIYNCSSEEFMELELRSSGFTQNGQTKSPPFTLQLRYVPALIADGEVAYIDPIDGQLAFHYSGSNRLIEIAPGNHGDVSSKALMNGSNTSFLLGLALREGNEPPAVARIDLACSTSNEGLTCNDLTLSTGVSVDGMNVSPRQLSAMLESQSSFPP